MLEGRVWLWLEHVMGVMLYPSLLLRQPQQLECRMGDVCLLTGMFKKAPAQSWPAGLQV